MPWGILGVLCMPLGLDLPCWQFMGWGIDWMTAVAIWTGSLRGSLWRVISFGGGALLICTLGIVILCLLRTPLRLIGALLIAGAVLVSLDTPQPDVLIAAHLQNVAVRGRDGKLAVVRSGSDTFAAREWLATDADPRGVKDETLARGILCDDVGCIARLKDGRMVAVVRAAEAFEEDCLRCSGHQSTAAADGLSSSYHRSPRNRARWRNGAQNDRDRFRDYSCAPAEL